MRMSQDLLLDGERILVSARTHPKILIGRVSIALVIAIAGITVALSLRHRFNGSLGTWIVVATVLAVLGYLVEPVLRWWTSEYHLTNLRLIEQSGVLRRSGRIIPLSRINDVSFETSLLDRWVGCGTLIVHDASQQEGLRLADIPEIESFHKQISTLMIAAHGSPAGGSAVRGSDPDV